MIRRLVGASATAMAVWVGSSVLAPVLAAPPTVVPSPGYDSRLIESRRAYLSYYYDEGPMVVAPRGHRNHNRGHGRHRHQR
jgi:hypothetical protein